MIKLEMKLPRTKMGSKILPLKLKFLVQVEKNKLNLYVISGKNLHTLNTQLIYNLANSMNLIRTSKILQMLSMIRLLGYHLTLIYEVVHCKPL